MLLGSNVPGLAASLQEVVHPSGDPGLPVARLTPLGWTACGPTHLGRSPSGMNKWARGKDNLEVGGLVATTEAKASMLQQGEVLCQHIGQTPLPVSGH
jgi:hypothetical protein